MSERHHGGSGVGKGNAIDIVREAHGCLQSGRLAEAERLCRRALDSDPRSFEALALLGVVAQRQERYDEADGFLARASALRPGAADVLGTRALVLRTLGRHEEALALLDRALAIRPDFFAAQFNRGNVLLSLDRHQEALGAFDRALAIDPDDAGALTHRGIALQELDQPQEALKSHERALARAPGHVPALINRANALRVLGHREQALESLQRALTRDPDNVDAIGNMAALLVDVDRHAEALALCDRLAAIAPDDPRARRTQADALRGLNRHEEALPLYQQAMSQHRDAAAALGAGNALQALGRYEEALAAADRALELEPELADAWNNRGNALRALGRHEEALRAYAKVLARRPDDVDANWNEALTRLTLGDFERGWQKYEWRKKGLSDASTAVDPDATPWTGSEELSGKSILLGTEQGFGDAIQFVRYVPLLAARGARVKVGCRPPLAELLRTVPGIDEVVTDADALPQVDYQAWLMSLPLAFSTRLDSIPADVPYVAADPDRIDAWRERIAGEGAGYNVGLAWRGNPEHTGAHTRDCPIESLEPLLDTPGCAFFSLQLEEGAEDIAALAARGRTVVDLADELGDFHEAAAAISALDLVITVDTAVAHLAGALDRPAWVLLQYAADWRWLTDREDSPWYPSLRLFRQAAPGDWVGVVERAARELAATDR